MGIKKVTGLGEIQQAVYSDSAQVNKVAEGGLSLLPLGALNAAKFVDAYQPVLIYNDSNATIFIKFGNASVTAPTGPADGIPVVAKSSFVANSGSNQYIISNSVSAYGYSNDNG